MPSKVGRNIVFAAIVIFGVLLIGYAGYLAISQRSGVDPYEHNVKTDVGATRDDSNNQATPTAESPHRISQLLTKKGKLTSQEKALIEQEYITQVLHDTPNGTLARKVSKEVREGAILYSHETLEKLRALTGDERERLRTKGAIMVTTGEVVGIGSMESPLAVAGEPDAPEEVVIGTLFLSAKQKQFLVEMCAPVINEQGEGGSRCKGKTYFRTTLDRDGTFHHQMIGAELKPIEMKTPIG